MIGAAQDATPQRRIAETVAAELRERILGRPGRSTGCPPRTSWCASSASATPRCARRCASWRPRAWSPCGAAASAAPRCTGPTSPRRAYHLGLVLQGARVTLGDLAAGLLHAGAAVRRRGGPPGRPADGRRPRADRQRRGVGRCGVRRRRLHPHRPRVPRPRRRVHAQRHRPLRRAQPRRAVVGAGAAVGRGGDQARRVPVGRRRRGPRCGPTGGSSRRSPPAAPRRPSASPGRTWPPRRRCCSSGSPTTSSTPRLRGRGGALARSC